MSAATYRRTLGPLIALVVVAALMYGCRLGNAPIHVHYDEVLFGLEAFSIAETGHDTNGRLFPLYFQVNVNVWYHPIAIYLIALFLKLFPVSDASIRLPTVFVSLVNISLVYFIGLRLFRSRRLALLASTLLVFTPAHLIHSRVAADYLYPLPFILTWMLCLLTYRETRYSWQLVLATSSLGLGFYSYVASVVMMPIYLAITCLFLFLDRDRWRAYALAIAGFAWPLLLIPPFFAMYPEILAGFQARYGLGAGPSTPFDLRRTLGAVLNTRFLAERLNLYYDFFAPGFLFVSGGSNVTNSTREAGVFLSSFAVFLLAGLYDAVTRPAREKTLVVLGFLTAPLAACLVVENYAIDRALALLPFGALLATYGIGRIWSATSRSRANLVLTPLGVGFVLAGAAYMTFTLTVRGTVSTSAPWLIVGGVATVLTGLWITRTKRWYPAVILLFIVSAIQYQHFYRDYFGDYGPRTAAWFGNNIQGAIERTIALHDERPAPRVLLSEDIRNIHAYWQFYTHVNKREDLLPKGQLFRFDHTDVSALPADTLVLCVADDSRVAPFVERGQLVAAGVATDPNDKYSPLGPGEHVTYTIYRRTTVPGFD